MGRERYCILNQKDGCNRRSGGGCKQIMVATVRSIDVELLVDSSMGVGRSELRRSHGEKESLERLRDRRWNMRDRESGKESEQSSMLL